MPKPEGIPIKTGKDSFMDIDGTRWYAIGESTVCPGYVDFRTKDGSKLTVRSKELVLQAGLSIPGKVSEKSTAAATEPKCACRVPLSIYHKVGHAQGCFGVAASVNTPSNAEYDGDDDNLQIKTAAELQAEMDELGLL